MNDYKHLPDHDDSLGGTMDAETLEARDRRTTRGMAVVVPEDEESTDPYGWPAAAVSLAGGGRQSGRAGAPGAGIFFIDASFLLRGINEP